MEDERLVTLYWAREEAALEETEKKYGPYLTQIAYNLLADWEDSRECVNDTYWKAWNSMPPHRPRILRTYLGKITRQVSIDRIRRRASRKRQASAYTVSLSELEEAVSAGDATDQAADLHLLGGAISAFLKSLSPEARCAFVGRYYYLDSIREIAAYCGTNTSQVKSMLHRTRQKLKTYLEQEGFL